MTGVWILGGYQSDFARNLHREGVDFAGLLYERIPKASAARILDAFPRLGMKRRMKECLCGIARTRPPPCAPVAPTTAIVFLLIEAHSHDRARPHPKAGACVRS